MTTHSTTMGLEAWALARREFPWVRTGFASVMLVVGVLCSHMTHMSFVTVVMVGLALLLCVSSFGATPYLSRTAAALPLSATARGRSVLLRVLLRQGVVFGPVFVLVLGQAGGGSASSLWRLTLVACWLAGGSTLPLLMTLQHLLKSHGHIPRLNLVALLERVRMSEVLDVFLFYPAILFTPLLWDRFESQSMSGPGYALVATAPWVLLGLAAMGIVYTWRHAGGIARESTAPWQPVFVPPKPMAAPYHVIFMRWEGLAAAATKSVLMLALFLAAAWYLGEQEEDPVYDLLYVALVLFFLAGISGIDWDFIRLLRVLPLTAGRLHFMVFLHAEAPLYVALGIAPPFIFLPLPNACTVAVLLITGLAVSLFILAAHVGSGSSEDCLMFAAIVGAFSGLLYLVLASAPINPWILPALGLPSSIALLAWAYGYYRQTIVVTRQTPRNVQRQGEK